MTLTSCYCSRVLLFGLLSATDLALTTYLVWGSDGRVYESNPVAGWWLSRFGWTGLALYKAAAVLLASAVILALCRLSPKAGGRVLGFGCAVLAGVICYSGFLAGLAHADANRENEETTCLAAAGEQLEVSSRAGTEYRAVLSRSSQALQAGQISLAEAMTRLAQTPRGQDPLWIAQLKLTSGGRSAEECLALTLMRHVAVSCRDNPERSLEAKARLAGEFQARFDRPLPEAEMIYWTPQQVAVGTDDTPGEDVYVEEEVLSE